MLSKSKFMINKNLSWIKKKTLDWKKMCDS